VDATSRRILEIRDLEARGADVLYLAADVAKREDMERVVALARERYGNLNGVIHSAGVAGGGIIQLKEPEVAARVLAPKVQGTLILINVLRGEPLDFVLLCSSVGALLGGVGQVDYCGANAFLDAFAHHARSNGGPPVLSVNWDAWKEVGMAVNTPVPGALQAMRDFSLKVGISPAEGIDALGRILAVALPQVAVFTMDMRPAIFHAQWSRKAVAPVVAAVGAASAASEVSVEPVGSDLERVVIDSWERILGREQIGLSDNFFELGGDSLTALQVVAILKARLGREVPIVTFYEAPTVALLARALGDGRDEKPVALEEVEQRAGTRLEMMQKRRQQRTAPVVLDPSR
jgi:NAD(P)-dependent dehydrogenase (short-subunit alcohol dehydrogenase family)/acyl carrier protein